VWILSNDSPRWNNLFPLEEITLYPLSNVINRGRWNILLYPKLSKHPLGKLGIYELPLGIEKAWFPHPRNLVGTLLPHIVSI